MGPKTDDDNMLRHAFAAGATGCRLTFSFGTQELQLQRAQRLKHCAKAVSRECFVVADLAGEKIRLGNFETNNLQIKSGAVITLVAPKRKFCVEELVLPVNSDSFFAGAEVGNNVILGDGSAVLEVKTVLPGEIKTQALSDGVINPNRGVVIQNQHFNPSSLTDKDISDLKFIAQSSAFDAVAISFVSSAEDVIRARNIINSVSGRQIPIIAKLETKVGIENVNEIADTADFLMAARGDLALFMPWTELPASVSKIQRAAKEKQKPWVLATQVVEGLERFEFPTRAEICDLAQWLTRGTSGIMLSYETAFGPKPISAIMAVTSMTKRWDPARSY